MKGRNEIIFDRLVYSCAYELQKGAEEYISEHFLGYQLSGETHAFYTNGSTIIPQNSIVFVKKNQLIRTIKYPSESQNYEFIAITLDADTLRQYALENKILIESRFESNQQIFFKADEYFTSYFQSLKPYIKKNQEATQNLVNLKIREAIELLLQSRADFKNILFDFSEPHKIDLKDFMEKNFMFNVSVSSFAKLTGRSLSNFKRDFTKIFGSSPKRWLLEKRLNEAYYLIKHEHKKATDIYLDLGFENLSHFYYSFKQQFGLTTTEIYK